MIISTKERIATGTTLAAICLIGLSIVWAYSEVRDANQLRRQADDLTRVLTELRMVMFDYRQDGLERARVQWYTVSEHLDRLIANNDFSGTAQIDIINSVRKRRVLERKIFKALLAAPAVESATAVGDESRYRSEAQLYSRLLISQQESFKDAFRLTELAASSINTAQQQVLIVILAGLTVIALMIANTSWLIRREVLNPIGRLQRGAQVIGEGDLTHRINIRLNNEIGELSQVFDEMTAKLAGTQAKLVAKSLRLQDSVRELEAFSYSVSHDLRAPLRGIDGWSLALQEDFGTQLDEKGRGYLDIVRAETQRMGILIDDLLQLSRVTRGELNREQVDMSALAQRVADRIKEEHPDRELEFHITPNLTANADPRLLEIVLTNLLGNACKFTGSRPLARIEFGSAVSRDPESQVERNVFFVRDNGVGFDMAYADKLFGAFQRLHSASEFPGTGIGLATVQRIIGRHDCSIWAEAKPDEGASFYFTLQEAT